MAKKKKKVAIDDLAGLIKVINKEHGAAAVRRMNDKTVIPVESISTGSYLVDEALGTKGFPKGRIVEIYGPEASGKTTLALHCIAQAQRKNSAALFVDAENALDMGMAKQIGVKPDKFVLSQPSCGEEGLDILETSVSSGQIGIAVVDSVSALVPRKELEGTMEDAQMALQARMMSKAMRKISGIASKTNTLVIFINQIRHKIGVFFGNPETTSGGNALKFFSSVRVEIRRIGGIKNKEGEILGNKVRVRIVKNKLAPPFKSIETELIFGHGFSRESEILKLAYDLDILDVQGTKYYYQETLLGKGREAAIAELQKNKKLYKAILTDVRIGQAK